MGVSGGGLAQDGLSAVMGRIRRFRLLNSDPEESLRLRMLALMTMWWGTATLAWVGGRPAVLLPAAALGALGQWVSWRQRASPTAYWTAVVLVALAAVSFAMRNELAGGLAGDRLPVAEYLLVVQALAAFGLRTRGGLYAQLGLSGLVLYFVAERAFSVTFAVFLIVFLALFLTFWAMAFLEDELRRARVQYWPEGQLARIWFWLGIVGGGLLVCSALAFSLLPPDIRGRAGSQRVGVMPFMGEDLAATGGTGGPPDASAPGGGGGPSSGDTGAFAGGLLDRLAGQPQESELSPPAGLDLDKAAVNAGDVVMQVRSRITSYWRGRVYDRFDGQRWSVSDASVVGPVDQTNRSYYWQTYYVQAPPPPGSVFVGYNPIRVVLPDEVWASGSLSAGATYSVLSQQPQLSARAIRFDGPGPADPRYVALPLGSDRLRQLARDIAGDTPGTFDRLWRIVSYLRTERSYVAGPPGELRAANPLDAFLFHGAAGNSLNFATATVLLARAAGIPARLAVGYLPGRFDPFSGTHRVRSKDLQAWAEVLFAQNGWVAFDASPRPELMVFQQGGLGQLVGPTFIFQTRVGGGLYRVLSEGASVAAREVGDTLGRQADRLKPAATVAAAAAVAISSVLGLWLRRGRRRRASPTYSRLSGPRRRDVLASYRRLQRLLRRVGVGPRRPSQTLGEYARGAEERVQAVGGDVAWLTRAAQMAAYDPAEPDAATVVEARARLARLKASHALRWRLGG